MKNILLRASILALIASSTLVAPAFASQDARGQGYDLIRTASAAPSPKQIEEAIRANNWTGAESMLNDVLREKPDSAKAWYWMAQTQEKLNHPSKAFSALSKAEQLQPNLTFASPGAVADMRSRLAQASSAQTRQAQRPATQTQPLPGYAGRAPVGDGNARRSEPAAPAQPSSHAWIYILLALAAVGGGGAWYYMNKRSKQQASDAIDAQERDRKALLGRANGAQERATSLSKTARFEGQESSLFGVAAAGLLSRANSALSRLKSSNATFDAYHERTALDNMEGELESLENQSARKAWSEEPASTRQAPATASHAPQGFSVDNGQAAQPQAYNGGYGAPAQQAPQTIIVNQGSSGSGLLGTMLVADMISHSGHDRSREYDLERDNQRLRDQQRNDQQRPAAPEPTRDNSSFDLGSNDSGWDSGSSGGNDNSSSSSGGGSDDTW